MQSFYPTIQFFFLLSCSLEEFAEVIAEVSLSFDDWRRIRRWIVRCWRSINWGAWDTFLAICTYLNTACFTVNIESSSSQKPRRQSCMYMTYVNILTSFSRNPNDKTFWSTQEVNFVRFWTKLNKSRFYQILSIQFTRLISLIQLPCNDRKNKYFRNKLSYFQVLTSITLRKRDRLEEDENNCNNQSNFPFDIRVFTRSTLKS